MIVVKVGGSLYDHPALGPALRALVESLAPAEVLLVPGGGSVADAVRDLDRTHGLGEEAAHWLALRALSVTAAFLERLAAEPNPPAPLLKGKGVNAREDSSTALDISELRRSSSPFPSGRGAGGVGLLRVLDCFAFAQEDESRPGALPHTWNVTTDSIAARAAIVFGADRLVLLKSVDVPPETAWAAAVANGWVDAHFAQIAPLLPCPVEFVNFRAKLHAPA